MIKVQTLTVKEYEGSDFFEVLDEKGNSVAHVRPYSKFTWRISINNDTKYRYLSMNKTKEEVISYINERAKDLLKTLVILEKDVREITKSLSILEKEKIFDNRAVDVLKRDKMEMVKTAYNFLLLVEPFIVKSKDDFEWIKAY